MAKKKRVKKVRHECNGDCNNCPNFGTKNCEMFANKYIRGKIIDSSLRTLNRRKNGLKKKKIIKKIIGR